MEIYLFKTVHVGMSYIFMHNAPCLNGSQFYVHNGNAIAQYDQN